MVGGRGGASGGRSDVEAAHAFGARALGVATGRVTIDELTATGAEAVLADLSETEAVMALLLS